jgi:hypothetical protein
MVLCVADLAGTTLAGGSEQFTLTDLGNLGGQSVAFSLNENGEVVGYSMLPDGDQHAFF